MDRTVDRNARTDVRARGSVLVGLSVLILIVGVGLLGTHLFRGSQSNDVTTMEADDVDSGALTAVRESAEKRVEGVVTVAFGKRERTIKLEDLGFHLDEQTSLREAKRLGAAGSGSDPYAEGAGEGIVPLAIDRNKATNALITLKPDLDRAPKNAWMDLEARTIRKSESGFGIDVYGSVSAIEAAVRRGESRVEFEGVEIPADVHVDDLGIADISTVLASFKTRFSVAEKSRNDNLKLAASRLDGHVMQPGELFSFNKVVGERSEKEGYKVAHVITSGEMVDGLAGGACQISTTLHGAAFFSGIEIVSSTPHSRPSTYAQMGLDATVNWPNVDLQLRNSYDFPVVIHYRVARGESVVEILGKERPYDKIAFERSVNRQVPFDTITREDNGLPVGSMSVEQNGFPGYKLKRYRKYYKNGEVVKTDSWNLAYRPVTEYVRLGINPDPTLPQPKAKKGHGPRTPRGRHYRSVQ